MSTLVGGAAPTRPIPKSPELTALLQGNAIYGETTRFKQIARYESFYACQQYKHLKSDWWGMSADQMETVSPEISVPFGFTQPAISELNVRMKRPTAPYHLAKAVVDRFTGLLFSNTRKPDVVVEGDPMTEKFLEAVIEQSRFWAKMREARAMGGACGSVLLTAHLREGRFSIEVHNPKHCQITWADHRALAPRGVLISYTYQVEEDIYDPKNPGVVVGTQMVDYLYRRIITDVEDTVYKAVRLDPDAAMDWEPEDTVRHDHGFFPGVWVQNLPVLGQDDGDPDCQGAWQSFDTIDRIISQMNKAILLNLDPTLVMSVDPKTIAAQGGSVRTGSDGALNVGPGGAATFLEITGGGVAAGMTLYTVLKQNVLDVVRCVLVDPQTISGSAQSGKALEYIYAPMLEKADDLRAQYGDLGVVPILRIIERMSRKYAATTFRLEDDPSGAPRIGRYVFDLPPTRNELGALEPTVLGAGGYIQIKWGPYFALTLEDKGKGVANLVAAKSGGLIDASTAITQAGPLFDIRDTAAVEERVKAEQEADLDRMMGGGFGGLPETPGGF